MIVGRLRATLGRKSTPISYGMHLMILMEKAGVDLKCTGEKEKIIATPIDHHTLRRMGYKQQHGGWEFVGRGKVMDSFPMEGQGEHGGEEAHEREHGQDEATHEQTQAESSAQARPRTAHTSSFLRPQPQFQNLATKSDIAHLQNFLVEQLHLMQATLLSRMDSLDSRVQNCEAHLSFHHPPPPSPIPPPTSDPKGKGPMPYPSPPHQPTASSPHSPIIPSPHHSPIPSPHHSPIPSPHHSPILPLFQSPSPQPIPIHSSSSSSVPSPSHYTIAPHTTPSPASTDSEATHSNPPSKPPSPVLTTTTPIQPTPSPPATQPPPKPTPPPVTAAYQRRRVAVSKLFPPHFPRLMPPP